MTLGYDEYADSADVFRVDSSGSLRLLSVFPAAGIRPAVSINSETRVTGTGSNVDPYVAIVP